MKARLVGLLFQVWPSLVLTTACIEGFDSLNGSDEAYFRLNDYLIDRPRVLAIRYWPPVVSGGDVVQFEALAATPEKPIDPYVEWWGCGTSVDQPFSFYFDYINGSDCLETSLAEFLGTGTVIKVQLPVYDVSGCDNGNICGGLLPIFARTWGNRSDPADQGYGVTYLSPDYLGQVPDLDNGEPPDDATLILSLSGVTDGAVEASRGTEIDLEGAILTSDHDCEFSWYVTAGTLSALGVTRATEIISGGNLWPNLIISNNILSIPKNFTGQRIVVYLVAVPVNADHPSQIRFRTATIEVRG